MQLTTSFVGNIINNALNIWWPFTGNIECMSAYKGTQQKYICMEVVWK